MQDKLHSYYFRSFNHTYSERANSIKPLSPLYYQISNDLKDNKQLFLEVRQEIEKMLENNQSNHDLEFDNPPFIIALKSLIKVLGKRWADS